VQEQKNKGPSASAEGQVSCARSRLLKGLFWLEARTASSPRSSRRWVRISLFWRGVDKRHYPEAPPVSDGSLLRDKPAARSAVHHSQVFTLASN
jgi:hypothetical protein